jgi:hypothetical protein
MSETDRELIERSTRNENQSGEGDPASERWTFYVHDDDEFVSLNDGIHGDTLLRIGGQHGSPGHLDVERVRRFASALSASEAHIEQLQRENDALRHPEGDRADQLAAALRSLVSVLDEARALLDSLPASITARHETGTGTTPHGLGSLGSSTGPASPTGDSE